MIAKVIVDVPVRTTDRPFDYVIPDQFAAWIQIGSRVGVPFGPRVIQGFVIDLESESSMDTDKLRPISQVLDAYPSLTPELVSLAAWLSRAYLCHMITALQAMIPGALKGKMERYLIVQSDENEQREQAVMDLYADQQKQILEAVESSDKLTLDQLLKKFPEQGALIKELLHAGILAEVQRVADRHQKKQVITVFPLLEGEALIHEAQKLPSRANRQKDVLNWFVNEPQPVPMSLLLQEIGTTSGVVKSLAKKQILELRSVEVYRDPFAGRHFKQTEPLPLTEGQRQVFTPIREAVDQAKHEVFLLHGVTGSGKTEVYLQAISVCLEQDKEAIVLVPEISLTPQMVERFKGRFGDEVAVLHSRLSTGERYDEWRKIVRREVRVVIGARSAVFAPFTRLGLIIIDEEHESSYKQEDHPKYHARDVAVQRALTFSAPVVLGSATPSLESYYASREIDGKHGREIWHVRLLSIPTRVEGRPLPQVQLVDMREELEAGNRTMFSRPLHQGILQRLERKEQIVLLLNRRGFSTFVMCRSCGSVMQCPECDISLTYHRKGGTLRCHYCGYAEREPSQCPECESPHIRFFGTGTQKVEEELYKHFPGIRVIRMDVDTTTQKGSHEKWLNKFKRQEADVLLGTQMVAKGLDFPQVTLVGVIAADTVLNLPDFRASERTFQLLTQVAGRAGRHELPGEVIIQTYTPEHYSIVAAGRHDYLSFSKQELKMREQPQYPPYCRLILITLTHENVSLVVRQSEQLKQALLEAMSRNHTEFVILGPVASPIPRLKGRYRYQCIIKYDNHEKQRVIQSLRSVLDEFNGARSDDVLISADVDPQMLM